MDAHIPQIVRPLVAQNSERARDRTANRSIDGETSAREPDVGATIFFRGVPLADITTAREMCATHREMRCGGREAATTFRTGMERLPSENPAGLLEVSVGGVSPDVHRVHFDLETYVC